MLSLLQAERKDARRLSEVEPVMTTPPWEEESFSWAGPTTIQLARTPQGFGFTLRHFIVYPPESAVSTSLKTCQLFLLPGRLRNRLEPMDTIFVKQVREGGPAHLAGLCTGDRIVKVNGESIIGKTYSQVIALIQDSGAFLKLCVMPKDEDILQLAYSQDAYLKGNDAYSGHAHNIPDPPPVCYSRVDGRPASMAQAPDLNLVVGGKGGSAEGQPDLGYRADVPAPPPPPVKADSVEQRSHPVRLGPTHRTECCPEVPLPALSKSRPSMASSLAAQYHPVRPADQAGISVGGLLGYPYTPPPRSSGPPAVHQNIDWRNYTTYREYIDHKGLHAYSSRTIQERLDNMRATSRGRGDRTQLVSRVPRLSGAPQLRRRSTSHDRAYHSPCGMPLRSASQERLASADYTARVNNWNRSTSQDDFPPSQRGAPKARARSCDYLETGETLASGRPVERRGYGRVDMKDGGIQYLEGGQPSRLSVSMRAPPPGHRVVCYMPGPHHFPKAPPHMLTSRVDGAPLPADRSVRLARNVSFHTDTPRDQKAPVSNHLGHQQPPRVRAESMRVSARETELGARTTPCSASSKTPAGRQPTASTASSSNSTASFGVREPPLDNVTPPRTLSVKGTEDTVVLREKSLLARTGLQPLRHHSYLMAVNEPESEGTAGATCWLPNDARREVHMKRLDKQLQASSSSNLDESLDAIPFIDEPSSPSADHVGAHIPASAVISVTPPITTEPLSPASPYPLIRRQLSHDQESLRNTIEEAQSGTKTERSKSCDEGLDNYKDEGRARSSVKHGLKGLRKALDGHKSSDDSGSRRDSSSDIFSDSSKEGWLQFRQLNTDKSRRVGGGIRPWKQMYAVLQGHSLCLYKDKREVLAQTSAQVESELQPISVKACLIDISYSDTKRKNVLRLTTSDGEYLFQAEDREDMLTWIRVIQENSSLDEESAGVTSRDLISRKIKEYNTMMSPTSSKTEPSPKVSRQPLSIRQTLLGAKGEAKISSGHSPKQDLERKLLHRDDTSPPKDRATWRKGIPIRMRKTSEKKPAPGVTFGVRLDDCPPAQTNPFVPLIVEVCCKLVEERGLEYTGIYRVPGNNAAISSMQEELNNKGLDDIDIQEDKWRDLNVISSLLKSFFRKLPDPLFTNEKYSDFIEANRIEDAVERLKVLKKLLQELPEHHYQTLKFLSAHLKTVSENCEKNKMEPRNLAIVFGPTLVRTSEDNMTHMVTHMPDQYKIVETLIQHYDWFFTEDDAKEPTTVTQPESAVESQPMPNIDHLLTNIGRTVPSPGEVSVSLTHPSGCVPLLQGSWGSSKDQYGKELLRSSIFASRKRKKAKDKAPPSSSDDDLDGMRVLTEPRSLSSDTPRPQVAVPATGNGPDATATSASSPKLGARESQRKDRDQVDEVVPRGKKDQKSFPPEKEEAPPTPPSPSLSPKPMGSSSSRYHLVPVLSDPPSQCDETTSDLGTMNSTSSQASMPRSRHKKSTPQVAADVCSITSDYSTTSSMTFLTGPEVQSVAESRGDEADDERSELVSEGRLVETDSESDFPVFANRGISGLDDNTGASSVDPENLVPPLVSGVQKANSDSSIERGPIDRDVSALHHGQEAQKGRSTGSLSSSSRSESEKQEPAWRLRITDRLKVRLRTSADDMFGVGTQKTRSPESRKRKGIRRRHTMGGQRDFAELGAVGDWSGRGQEAELSAMDRLKPKCSSQDFSIRDWIARERSRFSNPEVSLGGPTTEVVSDEHPHPASQGAEQVNREYPENRNTAVCLPADSHLHKISSSHVVRSRFYQYL
ncbi:rho GTPase-activating protein 21-like [Arapaima gigas]